MLAWTLLTPTVTSVAFVKMRVYSWQEKAFARSYGWRAKHLFCCPTTAEQLANHSWLKVMPTCTCMQHWPRILNMVAHVPFHSYVHMAQELPDTAVHIVVDAALIVSFSSC